MTIVFVILPHWGHSSCQGQKIHLTFDDGPNLKDINGVLNSKEAPSIKILDVLKKESVKSTFFINTHTVNTGQVKFSASDKMKYKSSYLVKSRANENRREFLEEIVDAGHKIGSHGFEHYSFLENDPAYKGKSLNSISEKKENVDYSVKIIQDFMSEPYVFRLPYGKPFPNVAQKKERTTTMGVLESKFNFHLQWNTDSRDWEYEKEYKKVLARGDSNEVQKMKDAFITATSDLLCSSGGVAVFHDIKHITADSLSEIINEVKKRGGEFVSFSKIHSSLENNPRRFRQAFTTLGSSKLPHSDVGKMKCENEGGIESFSKTIKQIYLETYSENIGSFTNIKNAERVSKKQSGECVIVPFTRIDGVSFHRVRCKEVSTKQQVYEQDSGDYQTPVGSFLNYETATNIKIREIKKGRDCRLFQYINIKGQLFHRVRCLD